MENELESAARELITFMKVLKKGDDKNIWWVGKTATCHDCYQQVQLEVTDSKSIFGFYIGTDHISFDCSNCKSSVKLKKSKVEILEEVIKQPLPEEPAKEPVVESVVTAETIQIAPPVQTGAHVGPSKVTSGWSDPFAGTSWGKR